MDLCVGDDGVRLNEAPLFGASFTGLRGWETIVAFRFRRPFLLLLFFWASKRKVKDNLKSLPFNHQNP
jgi:hypothetical protein